jgi:predicted AlkP superfamily phosphohydrolase/phosphomutase
MEHHPVDLSIVVFRMVDSIMHHFWADMDPNHPLHRRLGKKRMPDAILDAYRLLDDAVGRLVARAGSDTTVFVLSDHGFRAEYKRFSVNKWLRNKGFLALRRGRGPAATVAGMAIKGLGLTKLAKRALRRVTGSSWQVAAWASVDWPRTRVVYGPGPALYVNLKGRDALGIVPLSEYEALRERLLSELKQVRDPQTGLPIVAEVHRREDIYHGDAVDLAPDLIPEPAEYHTNGHRWGYGFEPVPTASWNFRTAERYAGAHANEGIFVAYGPHIAPIRTRGVHIADLAPTGLYALGLPVPQAMDGKARMELFEPSHTAAHPVQYADLEIQTEGKTGQVMPEADEEIVEVRLRNLGYI